MNASLFRTVSHICFIAGFASIILSVVIWWCLDRSTETAQAHAERWGIFVGLWAPTLIIMSNRFDRYADKAQPLPGQSADLYDNEEDDSGEDL